MQSTSRDLIIRLNRIEGQISALRREVESGTAEDCEKTLYQLKAAINGLKRFGEAFAREYAQRCLTQTTKKSLLAKDVDRIISTAFSLS